MVQIRVADQCIECGDGETVLDALMRCGHNVPSSCRQGLCQSCLMRSVNGDPGKRAQKDVRETLRQQGYFLSCQCIPTEPLQLSLGGEEDLFLDARIVRRRLLASTIMQFNVELRGSISCEAGQFVHLQRSDGVVRSYSVANDVNEDGFLELHVAALENGRMSQWLHREAVPGTDVRVRGGFGASYYVPGRPDQPLLLVGTGTGLAPLWGIVKRALVSSHCAEIHLYHGSSTQAGIYRIDELKELAKQHSNFHYYPCVSREQRDGFLRGRADQNALGEHPNLSGWRVFLCGHPSMVKTMKKMTYLAGASLSDIMSDPFETGGPSYT